MNTALRSKQNTAVDLQFQIIFYKVGLRNMGTPGSPLIWSPLKAIIFEMFLHSKRLAKVFEGACPNYG
jgi:hypothetical protein